MRATGGSYGVSGFGHTGVWGSGDQVGVYAHTYTGLALRVSGRAEFSRSGLALVSGRSDAPKSSVTITGITLSAKSMILATAQKWVRDIWVQAAVPDVSGKSITIFLSRAVTISFPVAWMIIERP